MGDGRHTGKRVAERRPRSSRGPRGSRLVVLPLAVGITLCVVAWGYLVKAAIDFGTTARTGKPEAWTYLGLASLGAVACLFVGLILVARIGRVLGWSSSADQSGQPERPAGPRPVGGRRRAK